MTAAQGRRPRRAAHMRLRVRPAPCVRTGQAGAVLSLLHDHIAFRAQTRTWQPSPWL